MTTFRIAHFSDPHLPSPPQSMRLGDFLTKRVFSYASWIRKRRRQHQPQVLAALVADAAAFHPDHTVVSGDLVNFATPAEFAAARAWLTTLGDPAQVTVSPGNHDALAGKAGFERFRPWREWLGDGAQPDFPNVRRRGPVAIVNLCSAVATAPFLATGRLGEAQLQRTADLLEALGHERVLRIVVVHHPVAPGGSARKALTDQAALRGVLKAKGAELVLHGHAHKRLFNTLAGPKGAIPVLGAPSASIRAGGHANRAGWHGLEIMRTDAGLDIRIEARTLDADGAFTSSGAYRLCAPYLG